VKLGLAGRERREKRGLSWARRERFRRSRGGERRKMRGGGMHSVLETTAKEGKRRGKKRNAARKGNRAARPSLTRTDSGTEKQGRREKKRIHPYRSSSRLPSLSLAWREGRKEGKKKRGINPRRGQGRPAFPFFTAML